VPQEQARSDRVHAARMHLRHGHILDRWHAYTLLQNPIQHLSRFNPSHCILHLAQLANDLDGVGFPRGFSTSVRRHDLIQLRSVCNVLLTPRLLTLPLAYRVA
jgi:hypothetical protein